MKYLSWRLNIHLLNVLYGDKVSTIKWVGVPKYCGCLKEKELVNCWRYKLNKLFCFSWKGSHFFISKTMFIQVWIFGKCFVKNKRSEPVTSRKMLTAFVAHDTIWAFKGKWEFLKNWYPPPRAWNFPTTKDFSKEMGGDSHEYDFKIFHNKILSTFGSSAQRGEAVIFQMTSA